MADSNDDDDNVTDNERPLRSRKLISVNLKRMYQEDAEDEIPDRFNDLIARLEASDDKDTDGT